MRPAISLTRHFGFAAVLLVAPTGIGAQRAKLTLTGGPIAFAAPTVTDFDNGSIAAPTAVTYTIAGVGTPNNRTARTTIISVRANAATLSGTVPVSDLQWRRSDLATWNGLTTANVNVESRAFVRNQTNDPWSNQLFFRLLLSYATDVPGTYSATVIVTITATTP